MYLINLKHHNYVIILHKHKTEFKEIYKNYDLSIY